MCLSKVPSNRLCIVVVFFRDEPVFVEMLVPFLRYLYCEPQRLSENALLRHGLLRVLLQPRGAFQSDVPTGTRVVRELIRSLFDLLPYMLVSRKRILTVLLKSLEGCNKKVNIILYIIHCCEFHMVPCFI